jgi:TonB-linked SusC/RagA family outer membrane protein
MKKLYLTLSMLFVIVAMAMAQRTVVGTIKGDDGEALIGASVRVKGGSTGTVTDVNGKFSLAVPKGSDALVVSYTGFTSQDLVLGASNVVDVTLATNNVIQDVVVTALGVTRYKNELAYSAQKVGGEDMGVTRDANMVNALAGKVAGLEIKRNNALGGSTNVVLRGAKSLTGNNQALFVVDGVPIDNTNSNTRDQKRGRGGYDYGSAVNDINSDDIASVTVLKGAAASALYGSRANNGVIMITTKKGTKKKGIGVTVNLGMNTGRYDPATFIKYQKQYGQGYGRFYQELVGTDAEGNDIYYEDGAPSDYNDNFLLNRDLDGDGNLDKITPTSEDASWGAKFDPNLLVYQWNAFDPSSPSFGKKTPWVAATNDPSSIFENSIGTSNGFSIDGTNEKGYFKLGYTRATDKGIMPNSQVNKDFVNFGAGFNLTEKLDVFTAVNYTSNTGLGRYGSGYESRNLMTNFRQWWPANVDVQEQRAAYERTKQNVTWNWADPTDLKPIYWDNPYWTRFENFQNDHRNRYFGNTGANYKVASWLVLTGRVSLDQYDEQQEERFAVGSIDVSEYSRKNLSFKERNLDFMATIPQREIANKLKFDALVGVNQRDVEESSIFAQTNGGISIPRLYSLSNTVNGLEAPLELYSRKKVNGVFGKVGFVYNNWALLEASIRSDRSSTLPTENNNYIYPAVSAGVIFSELIGANNILSFGKLRANYAQVGNDAPTLSVFDAYDLNTAYGSAASASLPNTKNNNTLKPERTKSLEFGVETRLFNDKVGFDVTYYNSDSYNQILDAEISRSTGYDAKFINAGTINNKGIEASINFRPINTKNFSWRVEANWSRNRNKVIDLGPIDNLLLASFQGGVSINATKGEPYGTIRGQGFVYHENGERIVLPNGRYDRTVSSNVVIGNVNPDWIGGLQNQFRFKNVTLGFLIDMKKGGQLFSLDQYYGLATGASVETAFKNDLGGDVRAPLDQNGGWIVPGVLADGTPNTKRLSAEDFGLFGYRRNPAEGFIYDAGYIKLREVSLDLAVPKSWTKEGKLFQNASLGIYGRNLLIIKKSTPNSDPEDGISSGNVQGYQGGSYPTTRVMGVNLKLNF